MKFITLLSLTVVFIALVSPVKSDHTILVLGDVGQVNQFALNTAPDKLDIPAKPTADFDMVNFKGVIDMDILGEKYGCKAQEIVILGDLVYTEAKNLGKNNLLLKKYEDRQTEGFKLFQNSIDYYSDKCKAGAPSFKKDKKKYDKITLLAGNHIFDVNYKNEAVLMANFVSNNGMFWKLNDKGAYIYNTVAVDISSEDFYLSPRIAHVVEGDKSIVSYLDVNLLPVICYMKTIMATPKL